MNEIDKIDNVSDLPYEPLLEISELNKTIYDSALDNVKKKNEEAIKAREKIIEKQIEIADKIEAAKVAITELKVISEVSKTTAESDKQKTLSQSEKEIAYFDRQKGTLEKYKVDKPCSMLKMKILVLIDLLALIIAFPFLLIFRFSTIIIETFSGLAKGVKNLVITSAILILLCLLILWLRSINILNI